MSTTRTPTEFAALIGKLRVFVENEVIPVEDLRNAHDALAVDQSIQKLRQRAVAQGLGNPRRPVSEGGLGLSWEECCSYLEQAGRSFLGPGALQCAAPGQPDIAALDKLANDSQRKRYLGPLMRGEKYSCFAMTEPAPGVGSDPRMLMTQANRSADGWVIDGHKWFISGAMRADFAIVVARTEAGVSWFLVDRDNPGLELVRDIPTIEPFAIGGGHGEIRLNACKVGEDALIGEEGKGLAYAQIRLEGARLFHCMRFIGLASRAMAIAQEYAGLRESQGVRLAEHQMVQAMVGQNGVPSMHALTTDLATLANGLAYVIGQMLRDEAADAVAKSAEFGCIQHVDLSNLQRLRRQGPY